MKQYWMALQPRERLTLTLGAVIAALLLFYLAVVEPFVAELDRLEGSVAAQQQELAWMRAAAAEVQRLRGEGKGAVPSRQGGQSLLSLVDRQARAQGLEKALQRLSPVEDKVRVRFEGAAFDKLLRWLGRLESEAGVSVDSLTLERLDAPGMVNATLMLQDGVSG